MQNNNNQRNSNLTINFKKQQRIVGFALIAAVIAANSIIMFASTTKDQNLFGNILRPITAAASAAFSLIVVYRQKLDGLFGRAYAALSIGLFLWLCAEVIWGYYSVILQIEVPFPSPADAFWLAGYGPLGYHIFTTSNLSGAYRKKRTRVALVSLAVAAFSILYIQSLFSASELSGPQAVVELGITIAYPVADGIIVIPAILAVFNSGRGSLTAIPWIFISWILTTAADSFWGYTIVTNVAGDLSVWNLIYNAAYLSMAAGLYWHNKFFIINEGKMEKAWKRINR